jgi:8-oxo-dGTP pyrophosphatase MutT (NUDIX family)
VRKRTLRDRAFQLFWRLQRPATLGVRGIVTDDSGRVLLVRHTYTPGWHFPGGGVESGETCANALRRELREEAGIDVETLELISVHANHVFFPNDHILVFRVRGWRQVDPSARGEIAELRFCDTGNPPAETTPGTKRRLGEVFGRAETSEFW